MVNTRILARNAGMAQKLAENLSQTGQVLGGMEVARTLVSKPASFLKMFLPPYLAAKAYLSPLGTRYLTTGLQTVSRDTIAQAVKAGVLSKNSLKSQTQTRDEEMRLKREKIKEQLGMRP